MRKSSRRLYKILTGMKQRCYNSNTPDFNRYGGRGITIYKEWLTDYYIFEKWAVENGYGENLSIDRTDNHGNYEPSNCRWVNSKIQNNNRRDNVLITHDGQTRTISQWADILNIPASTLWARMKRGCNPTKILSPKIITNCNNIYVTHGNQSMKLTEWASHVGIRYSTLLGRLERGWDMQTALYARPNHGIKYGLKND